MFSFKLLLLKIIKKIINNNSFLFNISTIQHFNEFYQSFIYNHLLPYFRKAQLFIKHASNNNSNIIWTFWWQGKSHMPLIIKRCINSIIHNSGHRVIIITKYNIKKYTTIPNYIFTKVYKKKITLTHLSDILRFNLLNNYGGLWIDSTMYCTSKLDSAYFSDIYTSGGYTNMNRYHQFISDSKWTGFLIGGCQHNPIFQFVDNFLKLYWKNNNYLIEYLIVDYALDYVYKNNIGNFKEYVNKIAIHNNPHLYTLVNILNKLYSSKYYKKITRDTNLFKLTYKQNFNNKNDTYFHYLINKKL